MANGQDDGIQTKVSMLGSKEFKSELSDISRGMAILASDAKVTDTAFKGQEKSVEALTEKQKNLQKQYDLHQQKVALINAQMEASAEKFGENSKQTQSLQIQLNNARAAMNSVGNALTETSAALTTAENAEKGLGTAADNAGKAVKNEGEKAADSAKENSKFKDIMAAAGAVIGAGFVATAHAAAAAVAAIGTAAAGAVVKGFDFAKGASEMADNVLTLSTQTGVGTETLQKWAYASELIDVPVETMTGSMAKMIKQMGAAEKGSAGAQEKFAQLGVSVTDSNGKLRDSEDVFFDCIDALGKVSNETERDALSMELFGKKAQDLNPLIEAGSGTLKRLGDEAEAAGAVFSGSALAAMGSFDDSMQRLNSTSNGLKDTVGMLLIPAFQPLVDLATSSMTDVSNALKDGLQPGEMETIITNLTTNIGTAMTQVSSLITDAIPVVTGALSGVVGLLVEQLPGLMDQLLPAAFGLLQSLLDAVVANVEPLTNMAVNLLTNIVTFLIENADKLLDAAVSIVTGLMDGIIDKLPELIPLAITMMVKLATSLIEALPELLARLPEIVTAIWDGLAAVDWLGLGLNLIQGLVNGLESAVSSLLEAIKNVFVGIWNAILAVFGIASPSTEAQSAAGFILDGLLQGFESAVDAVCDAVKRIFGKIWDAIKSIFGFGDQSEESKEAKTAGKDIMTGMQSGITDNQDDLKNAVANVSKVVLDKFRLELGIQEGTSTKTKPYGQATATGINAGMKDKAVPGTFGAANDLATAAGSAMNSAFGVAGTGLLGLGDKSASKFEYIGQAIAKGIAVGIRDNESTITAAATAAAQAAYEAAKAKLDIHSPSRVMEDIGLNFDRGFARGITGNMHEVVAAASSLSGMAARGVTGGSDAQGAGIDYARLGDAVADAMERKGVAHPRIALDGYEFTNQLEPGVSRAARRRGGQSAAGRTSRMVTV